MTILYILIKMKKNILFSFLSITNSLVLVLNKLVVLPFKTQIFEEKEYIESLLKEQLYFSLEIGEPPQNINISLSMETSDFVIESPLINNANYNYNKSKTYKNVTDKTQIYGDYFIQGYLSKETFYLQSSNNSKKKEKLNNIQFIYKAEEKKVNKGENNLFNGYLGLNLVKRYSIDYSIFKSLYNINAITKNIWTLYYIDKEKGILSIGEYPHQYEKDKFNEKDIKRANAIVQQNNLKWDFLFTDIIFGSNKINKERIASLAPSLGVIVGTNEFQNKVEEYFFNNLISQNKCTKNTTKIKNEYTYFQCDKNIDISIFEDLTFIHQEISYNFTLNKNDLFFDYNGRKYFLCVFPNFRSENWIFGTPFLKKYSFTFDIDSKLILFYDKQKKNLINRNNNINLIGIVIIAFLVLCIIFLGALIVMKIIIKPKRKSANELDDEESLNYKTQIDNIESCENGKNDSSSKLGL